MSPTAAAAARNKSSGAAAASGQQHHYVRHESHPLGTQVKRDGCLVHWVLFFLEVADFICLCMEPFFRWLPLLGLLYVLVPYYNQIAEEYDEEEDEWDDEGFDLNALNLER